MTASTATQVARSLRETMPEGHRAHVVQMRAPLPLRFPEYAAMPEGTDHLILRTFLYQLLRHVLGPSHSVGSEHFVYWRPHDPKICLSPDAFVKLRVAQTRFATWQCWKHGAPELAVEVVSPNDNAGSAWEQKLAKYIQLGVEELIRFDPEGAAGQRLRAWDRVSGDFVERVVQGEGTPCLTLGEWGAAWVVRPIEEVPIGLRLAHAQGSLLLTREEAGIAAG